MIDQLQKTPQMAVEVLKPIILQGKAVGRRAHCHFHEKNCFLAGARCHTAGSSCTAYSRQGRQQGTADATVLHFLAWVAVRRDIQEQEVTLENVAEFPTNLLVDMLGDLYTIEPVLMCPTALGHLDLYVRIHKSS